MTPARQIHPIVNNFAQRRLPARRPALPYCPPALQNQIQISQTSNRRMQNAADDDVDATGPRGSGKDWRRTLL